MKIMISAPYMIPFVERFRSEFEALGLQVMVPQVEERLSEAQLLGIIGDVDGVICGDDEFTDRVMAAAPRLKVISKWGTGVDQIDADAAARRGIRIGRTPNAFTEPVSDSTLAYILSFARRTPWMDRDLRAGRWSKIPGIALNEATLGIVGVGDIGSAVAKRAAAFGMTILGNDLKPIRQSVKQSTGLVQVDLHELLQRSDFVSLNCDLNPTSYHLMSDAQFALMKRTAYLVNTARGKIVDQKALVRALTEKQIAGAGLDVFEDEPLAKDDPLLKFDNCLYAPHNSNSSPKAWEHVHRNTINNLLSGLGLTVSA